MMMRPLPMAATVALMLCAVPACAGDGPPAGTSAEFIEAWLRFHETELCRSVDAAFVFRPEILEVWVVVEDEKDFQKFRDQLGVLRLAGRARVYPTRMPPEPKSSPERMPPPGLWNNNELISYMSRTETIRMVDGEEVATKDRFLRQRLLGFADQTLEWNRNLRRLAEDLGALSAVAFGSTAPPGLRTRATAVCRSHVRELDRNAGRLVENLTLAVPKPDRRPSEGRPSDPATVRPAPIPNALTQLSLAAQAVSRRVQHFIHPRTHTVGLEDLRDPDLLGALRRLRSMAASTLERLNQAAEARQ